MSVSGTTVVNVKVSELRKRGINSFSKWKKKNNTYYIGRDMTRFNSDITGSKWGNPFNVKKYGRDECLRLYEQYIRKHPTLYDELEELVGKELGCWCHPQGCHGHVLVRLLEEKLKASDS